MLSPELMAALKELKERYEIVGLELYDYSEIKVVLHVLDRITHLRESFSVPEITLTYKLLLSLDVSPEEALRTLHEEITGLPYEQPHAVRYIVSNSLIICNN